VLGREVGLEGEEGGEVVFAREGEGGFGCEGVRGRG